MSAAREAGRSLILRPTARGGFCLEECGSSVCEAVVDAAAWSLRWRDGRRWRMEPSGDRSRRNWILRTERADETAWVSGVGGPGVPSLLLSDGRVLVAGPTFEAGPGYEVRDLEAEGAYWTACRGDDHWTLAPTVAGERMEGGDETVILLARLVLPPPPDDGKAGC